MATKATRSGKRSEATLNGKLVLVCGGAGFIGSNFIRHILGKYPKTRIVNLDKLTYSGNPDNLREYGKDPRYTFVRGDIANQKTVNGVFEKHKPDYVINFAAETHVDRSIHVGALEFIHTNVVGVFNILEAVKTAKNIRSFVQVSTDEVYGSLDLKSKDAFSEDTAFAPNVPYAATKAGGDMLCRAYHNTWGIPVIVTHCSNNYGPRQYPEKLIPFFVLRMLEGKTLPLYGDGHHVRDWIYVLDHCKALELCMLRGKSGAVYNIGADNEMNNREIANRILAYFGKGKDRLEFVADRPGHDRRYAIDSSYIRKELGWKPTHNFEDAFSETVQWYIDNPAWVEKVRRRTGVFNPHIDLWRKHQLKK
ncbi:MAG TPA: dTDP-glucose 4,6-dehydratase [Candidatus Paceibacterota bacterium]|nr:dTDP-glucose 4,6-dehydratase [Candidatus Paceibacterota bacterium]